MTLSNLCLTHVEVRWPAVSDNPLTAASNGSPTALSWQWFIVFSKTGRPVLLSVLPSVYQSVCFSTRRPSVRLTDRSIHPFRSLVRPFIWPVWRPSFHLSISLSGPSARPNRISVRSPRPSVRSIHLSAVRSFDRLFSPSVRPVNQSFRSVCRSFRLSVPSVRSSVCPSICPSVHTSVHPFVHAYIRQNVRTSSSSIWPTIICLSACWPTNSSDTRRPDNVVYMSAIGNHIL